MNSQPGILRNLLKRHPSVWKCGLYLRCLDDSHCIENQSLNVTSICYAELVQRNLEFTLKEYESSEKDAIPGQQIVFDFWLNNSVPTLDARLMISSRLTHLCYLSIGQQTYDLPIIKRLFLMAILYLLKQVEVTNFRYMSKDLLSMRLQKMKPFYLRSA